MFLPLYSAEETAALDRRAIDELGIPSAVLMESAAWACVEVLLERFSGRLDRGVQVYVGPGNNGGDGLAIARRLHLLGVRVSAVLVGSLPKSTGESVSQLDLARACGVSVVAALRAGELPDLPVGGVVVDALFGTGLARPLEGLFAAAVQRLAGAQDSDAAVLAVDIPSGVSGTTGEVLGCAARADVTVTFQAAKVGHFNSSGSRLRGALVIADIGIPMRPRLPGTAGHIGAVGPEALRVLLPPPPVDAHKGTMGHLLVVAGGPGKEGAGILAASAAVRAGAGLVTLAVPGGRRPAGLPAEVMTEVLPTSPDGELDSSSVQALLRLTAERDAVAVGPGLGTAGATPGAVAEFLSRCTAPAVVDADALNALAMEPSGMPGGPRVWTPHPGEAARLLGTSVLEVQADRIGSARRLAALSGGTALLKGAATVVSGPNGAIRINTTGHSGLASGGSGDVLTGIVGALLARGLDPAPAAVASAVWHGLAASVAGEGSAPEALTAGDVTSALGPALARARSGAAMDVEFRPLRSRP